MPQPEPRVRARHCQEWLTLIEKSEEPWRSRFFERLAPAMREEIESSSRVGWLPVTTHVALAETLLETFGELRAHAFYRHAASAWLTGPLLGPVLKTSARILDVTPRTIVRWAPRGWEISFKDCGELAGESHAPGHARLIYRNLPAVCTASEAWLASAQGSAYGVLDVIGCEGVVRLDTSGKSEGRMHVDIEWSVKS
jgi:hypothetical protein